VTKRDYIAIARLLIQFRARVSRMQTIIEVDDCVVRELIVPLAKMMKEENTSFNYLKFLAACNVKLEDA
jgi:hypothetical protein